MSLFPKKKEVEYPFKVIWTQLKENALNFGNFGKVLLKLWTNVLPVTFVQIYLVF